MPEAWFGTPLIVTVGIATVGTLIGIGIWVGKLNADQAHLKSDATADRSTLKDFMNEIRGDIKKILRSLPPQTATGASPSQLTEFGERVAKGIDAIGWATHEAGSVLEDEELVDLEPFEIEAFCEGYVQEESRKEGTIRDKVRRAIYDFGIDRDRALPVLRIPLREALLKRQAALQR